jgi:hypothetical protein
MPCCGRRSASLIVQRVVAGTIAAVSADGFMIQIHSPAAKVVGESSLALIAEGDRVALYEAMRRQLLPIPALSEFTVAVPEFVPTVVTFRSLRTAAMILFGRAHVDASVPDLVGAAFIFAGTRKADEDEAIRRTSIGRDLSDDDRMATWAQGAPPWTSVNCLPSFAPSRPAGGSFDLVSFAHGHSPSPSSRPRRGRC